MSIKKLSTRELCHIGIFVAIIAVFAQISIPMPFGVPMTLQTLAIPLAGVVLGIKNGTLATLSYVLLGVIGVPVFANFTGGMGMIFSRTGGFILSFPLVALTAGIGAKKNDLWLSLWLIIGAVINYICGMLMFSFITSSSFITSFTLVVLPFIPTTIIKIIIVMTLGKTIKRRLLKAGLISPS